MKKKKKTHVPFRMNVLFFVVFLLFSLLILRLGVVQIVFGENYTREVQRTEDVTVNTSVPRGKIFDKNGKAVVDNTPLNAITYTRTQSTTQKEELDVAKKLAKMIDKPDDKVTLREKKDYWMMKFPDLAKKKITDAEWKKYDNQKFSEDELYNLKLDRISDGDLKMLTKNDLEVLAIYREMIGGYNLVPQIIKKEGVTPEEFAVVSEHLKELPGVDITTDWDRYYAFGSTLKSILGNVSRSDQGLPKELADYYVARGYSRNDRVGTSYIEQQYEDVLQGEKAKIKNITDKSGNVTDTQTISKGQRGNDIVLSVDIELQQKVEKIIEDELLAAKKTPGHELLDRAFVTMMDPYTGEILAMAGKQYVKNEKTGKPELRDFSLGNFTTSYAMGSAVKGATVLTGYKTGAIKPGEKIQDETLHIKGTPDKSSWKYMGVINDLTALKQSSNVYMFKTAIKIGGGQYRPNEPLHINMDAFDTMRNSFKQFGLGVRTGIDLPGEQKGYEGWTQAPGLLLDFAIGQFDTYTPLQMAQYVSTIANGGYRMEPHIVKEIRKPVEKSGEMGPVVEEIEPKVLNHLDMKPEWIKRVQEGFREVAQEPGGTAYSAFYGHTVSSHPTDYSPASKTGTAEGLYDGPKRQEFVNAGKEVPMTWNLTLVGYAPSDHPEVAFSVVVPWAYQDDPANPRTNTNIGKKIMDAYFDLKKEREEKGLNKSTSVQKVENIDDVQKGLAEARKENDEGITKKDQQ
ncbi:peptidoglycan D,D-transpeptidase FtsI family protein [Falsibacillus albus]|uniref:serine-type D-Ala-D-Ala carboxypeptidase n=1 Tax=Falsibacillus albus TaxID=2478915 RepID=A0A3L7K8C8_9BACI|nr:penicillin-binding protein 2 [Falsibacillus albus]RLQ98331.1 penicillin-binding protein 2 [Falsibacillus albus]